MHATPTWVVVADGAIARYFEVDAKAHRLVEVDEDESRRARRKVSDLLSDREGRGFVGGAGTRHHGMEPGSDPHRLEQAKFARHVAERLGAAQRDGRFAALVIAAAPRALADLRASLSEPVADAVRLELDKDLTHESAHELEARLGEQLWGTSGVVWEKSP